MTRRHRAAALLAALGIAVVGLSAVPALSGTSAATPVTTGNGCSNNVEPTPPSVIPMVLDGTAPAAGSVGSPVTVTGLKITAQVPAAFIQTGVNLGLLKDGQSVTGAITVVLRATNATPATVTMSGNGSGVVHAPGSPAVAQALTVVVSLGSKSWTPTAVGPFTLAQAKTGTQAVSPAVVTDGSLEVDAHIGTLTVKIICKPGTISGNTVVGAASVSPFVSVDIGPAGSTTTTSSTTPTSGGPTSSTTTSTTTTTTTTPATVHSPALTLGSTVDLNAGDPLTVTGRGFSPYASLAVMECGPKFLTAKAPDDECDLGHAVTTSSDVGGGFATTFTVLESGAAAPDDFHAADTTAECPPPQSGRSVSCLIVVRNTAVDTETATMPISFNIPGAPQTATTVAQVAQVVETPAVGSAAATPVAAAPTGAASTDVVATLAGGNPPTGELAETGPLHHTLALTGLGLLLLDLGYLALSSSRPKRRITDALAAWRG